MFGRASWRSEARSVGDNGSSRELLRRSPRVPPPSTTAPEPPMAASEPEGAREIVEKEVDGSIGIVEWAEGLEF